MKVSKSSKSSATEIQIQNTIIAYHLKQYQKINKIACAFKVFYSTIKNYLLGVFLWIQTYETQRNLLNAKKNNNIMDYTSYNH